MPHGRSLQYGAITLGVLIAVLACPTLVQCQPKVDEPKLIRRMMLSGHRHFDDDTIRNALSSRYLGEPWDESKLRNDIEQNLMPFLKSHGFLHCIAEIEHVSEFNGQIQFSIRIVEGPQFRLSKLEITGATVFSNDELTSQFVIQQGDILDMSKIKSGIDQIQKMYHDKGHTNWSYRPAQSFDGASATVSLKFQMIEGRN